MLVRKNVLFGFVVALLTMSLGAEASTIDASGVPGGFSSSIVKPTAIGAGITAITGRGQQNEWMQFVFDALPTGAQMLSFDFSLPKDVQGPANSWAYFNGGGYVRYSIGTAFIGNAETGGTTLGNFSVSNTSSSTLNSSLTLSLNDLFTGPLYVGIRFTYGSTPTSFSVNAPSNASMASAVPVPASFLLFGPVLAGMGIVSLRRRKRNI